MTHRNLVPADEDDPVVQLLLQGKATTVHEAVEMHLNSSLPQVIELLRGPLTDEELGRHPLLKMLLAHGSRGREDSP